MKSKVILTMCDPSGNTGCPKLKVNRGHKPERQIVITDDFGGEVQMHPSQFGTLVSAARTGRLDHLTR